MAGAPCMAMACAACAVRTGIAATISTSPHSAARSARYADVTKSWLAKELEKVRFTVRQCSMMSFGERPVLARPVASHSLGRRKGRETCRFDRARGFDLTPQLRYWGRATVLP